MSEPAATYRVQHMNPTPTDIVESLAWEDMIKAMTKAYFDLFVATDPSDFSALCELRSRLEALHEVEREMTSMARAQTPRGDQ